MVGELQKHQNKAITINAYVDEHNLVYEEPKYWE